MQFDRTHLLRAALLTTIILLPAASRQQVLAGEITFIEQFALAPDRSVVLSQLIPGTEDYYYYHCLHFQNLQQYDRVEQLLKTWTERHRVTAGVREIRHRQALLTYGQNPDDTLRYLISTLGLSFNHQRDASDRASQLPTSLDASMISRERLRELNLKRRDNLQGFEDSALAWLTTTPLSVEQRRELLQRLDRPDIAGLPRMILEDMRANNRVSFGTHPIHRQLLSEQLEELVQLDKSLLNETEFVNTYLRKLLPPPDVDWQNDLDARQQYLDELWRFVSRLSDAHNSLKTHVLYHRLALDIQREQFDKSRLITYLRLPRSSGYINPRFLSKSANRRYVANLAEDFGDSTRLPPVGDDEAIVRPYLQHFLVEASSYREFQDFIRDDYLKQLFAETKIVNGLGDPEQWASLLTPTKYQELRERVDLEFAESNPRVFALNDEVAIDVYTKNIPTLIAKIYRVNARNYYQDLAQHVSTSIDLDGLVANREVTQSLNETPFQRIRRRMTFPELTEPGIYVIDLIGNGKSSRALIHKGQLRQVVRQAAAGYAFTVLDEDDNVLDNAQIWIAGKLYLPNSNNEILVPFSTQPRQQSIVLLHDKLATLDAFWHGTETYHLRAGIHLDRESLRSRRLAPVLIRVRLMINQTPISLTALEDPQLEITSIDYDGISTTTTVSDLELHDDRDLVHSLRVPPRLSQLTVGLRARVSSLSENKKIDLFTSETVQVNDIETTQAIDQLQLVRSRDGYAITLLGKTGEAKSNRPLRVSLKHRDFRDRIDVMLRTDEFGRSYLGQLESIQDIQAQVDAKSQGQWSLEVDKTQYGREIHAAVGDVLEIPLADDIEKPTRETMSLLEIRGDTFVEDYFARLAVRDAAIVIEDLPAGDYELRLKSEGARILLRISDGPMRSGHAMGSNRILEVGGGRPLRIADIRLNEQTATIQLRNTTALTRVHVLANYFAPAFDPFRQLASSGDRRLGWKPSSTLPSFYVQGRNIGDELRYILERKYAAKFPGNMLNRPQLLLNPWDVKDTHTQQESLATGDEYAAEAPSSGAAPDFTAEGRTEQDRLHDFANLDFLASESVVTLNLKPDADGRVEVDLTQLDGRTSLYVIAVDQDDVDQRTTYLPLADRPQIDLRLADGLDPQGHFALTKQISLFEAGQTVQIDNLGSGRFQLYDSLPRVFQLYETLLPKSALKDFRFILSWHELSDAEKRDKYSRNACHELNFFIALKDPDFFQSVVRPYLAHKLHKTFLDEYLLDKDLTPYLFDWKYSQLNSVERILLGLRIDGELARTLDNLRTQWEIIPTDHDNLNRLFDTGLLGQALEPSAVLGARVETHQDFFAGAGLRQKLPSPKLAEGLSRRSRPSRNQAESNERFDAGRGGADQDGILLADDMSFRKAGQIKRLFQTLDQTKEWAENNYYRLPINEQGPNLVTVNDLWLDWGQRDHRPAFRSKHFAQVRNFTEAMFALALLDLPNESPEHETEVVDQSIRIKTAGPVIVLHEQIDPAIQSETAPPILVSQNYFRASQRHKMVNGERVDQFVTGEFLYQTVYGCQLVITNPTSSQQKLNVLTQLPTGALPVQGAKLTQTVGVALEPYHTTTIDYFFYFPAAGDFDQFPAHVTQDRQIVAVADAGSFHVVTALTDIDRASWDYVSQHGSPQDVLEFLDRQNLQQVKLDRIAFRMSDASFFQQVTQILRRRHMYDHTLWSYAVRHKAEPEITEYLAHATEFLGQCGNLLVSPLAVIDPVARRSYQHLEYFPLVNGRSHQVGKTRQILNDRFYQQYHRWLKLVSYMRQLDDTSRLVTVYYLLLQDRVEEAIEHFAQIDPQRTDSRMQYDYCLAYLSISQGETDKARRVAHEYDDYPVDRWRNAFAMVNRHLDEIEGVGSFTVDPSDRNESQDELAAASPSYEFDVEAKQLRLRYRKVKTVTIHYYLMDIELLFSRNPFVQRQQGQFAYIAPNLTETVELPEDRVQITRDLPKQLLNQNVLIEVEGAGQRKAEPYYSNALSVQVIENYGQLRVTDQDSQRPVRSVYCKVYALLKDGRTVFYKDGYTDLRGRFDYATLSTNQLDSVQKLAVLILSEENGATVREVNPPKR